MFSYLCGSLAVLRLFSVSAAGQTVPSSEELAASLMVLSDAERAIQLALPDVATAELAGALLAIGDQARLDSEYRRAALAFQAAEDAARRAGAEAELGRALNGKADSLGRATDLDRAMAAAEESIRFHEARRDENGLAEAWNTVANVHFYRGDYPQTLEAAKRVRELWTRSGNRRGVGRVLNNTGNIHKARGNLEEAAACFEEALRILEELGDQRSASVVLNNIALVHSLRGDYPRALEVLQRTLALAETLGDRNGVAKNLDSLGNVYREQGAYSRALDAFIRSLEIRRSIGDQYAVAESENNIGLVHFSQGDYGLAIDAFKRGLRVSRQVGAVRGLAPEALFNVGAAAWRLGEKERALANLRESLALSERDGLRSISAMNLHALGQAALDGGRLEEAEALFRKSLAIREEQKDQAGIAETLNGLASLRLSARRYEDALGLSRRSTDIAREFEQFEALWEAQTLNGTANRRLGRTEEARSVLLEAVSVIERLRAEVAGPALGRARFFETKLSPYHELIDISFAAGSPEEALEVAERAKGRALAEMLQRRPEEINFDTTAEEREEERRLQSALRALNERLSAERAKPSPDERRLEALEGELRARRSEYEAFQIALYARHPELRARRGEAAPFRFSEAAALVRDQKVALLEYVVAEEAAYLFVITRSDGVPKVEAFRLNADRERLAARVRRFRERLAARDLLYGKDARELYDLLLAPARGALAGRSLLVLVPDGPLWEAPFQALQDPDGRYLVESAAVSYVPSLTLFRESLHERSSKTEPRTVLAMGLADSGTSGLAPLPDAELQAAELGRVYGSDRTAVYLGREATEDRFKMEAPRHRIVHLASHGILDEASPLYSHVVLSPGSEGAPEDGLLEAWELLNLELHAELVILSACETGRGRVATGEGIVGTTWALLVAGSEATVASQWKVESTSTATLMTGFHQGLSRGEGGKAEQLRRATLEVLKDPRYAHPFYWAPFVLVGDPF
jgi:CHAT domain-containing protein/Tfp pilus assembly protein PilF